MCATTVSLSRSSLTIDSCLCGYHKYSAIWESVMGEELQCGREVDNPHDPYPVSVLKCRQIVEHVPRSICRPYSVFLRSHGTITCTVTGNRHYSSDLLQGGMKILCSLGFTGDETWFKYLSNLFKSRTFLQVRTLIAHFNTNNYTEIVNSCPNFSGETCAV